MTELRSRYWLAECPDGEPAVMGIKHTERETGQFDAIPYEPFDVPCWLGLHPQGHTAYRCTEQDFVDAD